MNASKQWYNTGFFDLLLYTVIFDQTYCRHDCMEYFQCKFSMTNTIYIKIDSMIDLFDTRGLNQYQNSNKIQNNQGIRNKVNGLGREVHLTYQILTHSMFFKFHEKRPFCYIHYISLQNIWYLMLIFTEVVNNYLAIHHLFKAGSALNQSLSTCIWVQTLLARDIRRFLPLKRVVWFCFRCLNRSFVKCFSLLCGHWLFSISSHAMSIQAYSTFYHLVCLLY